MKVWKITAIASMLFSTVLSVLLCRNIKILKHRPAASMKRRSPLNKDTRTVKDDEARLVFPPAPKFASMTHLSPWLPGAWIRGQAGGRAKRARSQKPCSLKELEVTVTDLGLGYESEETVLFKYCTGTCEAAAKHYDKTLKNMRKNKMIKRGKDRPCCRPLSYDDDVSFLDNYHEYHTLKELSAKECGCV
uniref:Neurturin n=1 Tax=Latimeria chalumnae TaxID=7897 RepID=H3B2Y5_LATCH